MSRLEELIAELCPDGVPYKKVKEVYSRLKGTPITAGKMKEIENPDGEIRVFAGGKTVIDAMEKDIPNANITRVPAVLVQSRGVIDVVFYDKPFTFKNEMWAYTCTETTSVKYLYYVLKNNIQKFRDAASGMGSLPQISLPVTEEFVMPVPPLPVQHEIVMILDNFSGYTAKLIEELTAELTARQKQYKYYASMLFENAKGIKPTTLEEVSTNCDYLRKPVTSGKREAGAIPYYGASGIVDYVKDYILDDDYLLISEDGANLLARSTPIAFSISGKAWVNNHAHILKFNSFTTQKYVERYLNLLDLTPFITGAAQPKLNQKNLNTIQIPLPPMDEQERIMIILDKFDSIVNDITSGLPAEITARKKQYEYYRDKLLTFRRLPS